MEEVFELADKIIVLKDGEKVAELNTEEQMKRSNPFDGGKRIFGFLPEGTKVSWRCVSGIERYFRSKRGNAEQCIYPPSTCRLK